MFRTLADEGVNILMISTSTIRISVVVAAGDMERAAGSLHTAFGLDGGQRLQRPAAGAQLSSARTTRRWLPPLNARAGSVSGKPVERVAPASSSCRTDR